MPMFSMPNTLLLICARALRVFTLKKKNIRLGAIWSLVPTVHRGFRALHSVNVHEENRVLQIIH